MSPARVLAITFCLLAVLATWPAAAQVMRHSGGEGNLVILNELGIVAGAQDGSEDLRVITVLPDGAGKSEVPLQQGDLLLMIDGKRVRDAATLREIYEGADVGETVKVGFRRGDERFLVSFTREAAPAGERRVVMVGGPGHDMGDILPLPEFGVVLKEADGKVVVAMELPTDQLALEQGDQVKSINGRAVGGMADFREAYEALAVGSEVGLVVARGADELNVTRAKVDASGMIRMRSVH